MRLGVGQPQFSGIDEVLAAAAQVFDVSCENGYCVCGA
jgi:hypothetical protein